MIATNSLAAFAQDISAVQGPRQVRGTPVAEADAQLRAAQAQGLGQGQRTLESVPPQPARPLPRGSLLDLKV